MNYNISQYGHEYRFTSENQPPNRGRKKNKFRHLRDVYELGTEDVKSIIQYLLSLTLKEIEAVSQDPETPIIVVSFCSAIARSLKKDGTLHDVKYILDHIIDQKSKGDTKNNETVTNITEAELEQALKKLDDNNEETTPEKTE